MLKYIARRLGQLIPVLLGVSVLVFFGMHLVPGDVAQLLLGDKGTAADLQRLRHQLGLDQPVYVQYVRFLLGAVRGDLGASLRTRQSAIWEIGQALPVTIELSLAALLFAVAFGLAIGVAAARRPHSLIDTGSMIGVLIGVSMPVFWTGILLLLVFGGILGWLPLGGILDEGLTLRRITGMAVLDGLLAGNGSATASALRHLVLPAVALGVTSMATIARMARSTMLDVLTLDYVRTARAKGVGERQVVAHHALRNALLPVVTLIGLEAAFLMGGLVVVETVFNIPGVARFLVEAIRWRDYPIVQNLIMYIAIIVVVVNFTVDMLYAALDPRIKYSD